MSRIILRPSVLGFSALALWCAQSCLAPGSLENEERYRIQGDGAPSGQSGQSGDAEAPGCVAACTTFRTTCATVGCHTADNPAAQLDLESPGVVARMKDAPAQSSPCFDETLLVPGDTDKSLIYTKLIKKPACGLRMPLTGPLEASEIECVRRWVLAPSCDGEGTPDASVGSGGMGSGGMGSGGLSGSGGSPGMGGNVGSGGAGMAGAGGKNNTGGKGSGGKGSGGKGNGGAAGGGGMPGGGGGMSGAGGQPPVGVVFYVEGESASLVDPMASGDAADASGGKYIAVPAGATKVDDPTMSTMGIATFMLNVTTAGNYGAFGRIIATSTSTDSFWVKMDGGDWVQWNNITNSPTWVWDDVHDTGQADAVVHYQLSAGMHTFVIAYREAGAQIDKLAFATDPAFMPTGMGQ